MGLDGRFGDLPDCAIFADTGFEPRAVYDWLADLEALIAPFPIHRVSNGDLRKDATEGLVKGRRMASLPFFLSSGGMGRRQCTNEYKIRPIRRWIRAHEATPPTELWLGISTDEAHRMKPSQVQYIRNRFPLIEAGLSRSDCAAYLKKRVGRIPPKSACIGCPFHGDAFWVDLKQNSPDEFEQAVAFDAAVRRSGRMRCDQYVHRSLKPLNQVAFMHEQQGDLFGNECEGVCGL
jgi:hypothetical protein